MTFHQLYIYILDRFYSKNYYKSAIYSNFNCSPNVVDYSSVLFYFSLIFKH